MPSLGVGRHGRQVPHQKEDDGAERAQDGGGNGEAHQDGEQRLAEAEVQAQQRGQHAVEQRVAQRGEQDDEWELECDVARLPRRAPATHRRAIRARASQDHCQTKPRPPGVPLFQPAADRLHFAAQEDRHLAKVKAG